ncbi:MAG: glutamyl-tRNA reductase [Elusimicrobia bacterium RIFCSPLOWO2_01_FULL_54_10]|nr:MAG: glutamyl-tRNA reductase [Elusimicrobia bacterium RIFCSPLOWO2_01_FULL_54_10]
MVGISHKTAPVELREKLSFGEEEIKKALQELRQFPSEEEAVLLSTCNRTELYIHSHDAEHSARTVKFLKERFGEPGLDSHLYFKEGESMVRHLFSVASGLDSLVQGEQEIQKQVKDAYSSAQAFNLTSKLFNVLFQRALYVGKLVRTHTGIAHGALSVGSVAVSLAEKIFGDLSRSSVLLFGAGEMAEICARHLISKKVRNLMVANRTLENAQTLAQDFKGEALSLEAGLERVHSADIVITSVASERPILTDSAMKEAMRRRGNRSLFVIDIAVPRNVETSVHSLDNLYLYNIDDLEAIAAENLRSRGGEIEKARAIANLKATEFWDWAKSLQDGGERSFKHSLA